MEHPARHAAADRHICFGVRRYREGAPVTILQKAHSVIARI